MWDSRFLFFLCLDFPTQGRMRNGQYKKKRKEGKVTFTTELFFYKNTDQTK